MKINMRFGIGALLTAMLLVSMAFAPAVSATENSSEKVMNESHFLDVDRMPDELVDNVEQVDAHTFVFRNKVDDKKEFIAAWESYETEIKDDRATTRYVTREDSGSDTSTRDLYDSYLEGETYFHGHRTDYVISQEFVGDGHTKAKWYGSNPYYADKITLDSQVKTRGVSVSLSIPLSAGFSISGDTATYSGEWDDAWSVAHYYQDLEATALSITDEDQNDAEKFRFGTQDYILNTHVDLDA
ncbi:MAG: hypothetical protein RBT65_13970 [Methanolobus sp.]|nr:hypothetical protein [Methanolobus sp.]